MMRAAALVACVLLAWQVSATLVLTSDGITVYDTVNNISWLADANLPSTNRFGVSVCNVSGTQRPVCLRIRASACAWI
jgi:hypothetical protein